MSGNGKDGAPPIEPSFSPYSILHETFGSALGDEKSGDEEKALESERSVNVWHDDAELFGSDGDVALSSNQDVDPLLVDDEYGGEGEEGESAGDEKSISKTFGIEMQLLAYLAFGMLVSRISWIIIKSTDTAIAGHVSTLALTATSYSDIWTASTGVFLSGNVLSIFVANAMGTGNAKLAGVWLQVSLLVLATLSIPVIVLWLCTEVVLADAFGVDSTVARMAGYYSSMLAICLPAKTFFSQLSQYLTAQGIVKPSAITSTVAAFLNLVLGLVFVLGVGVPGWAGWGFIACPLVTVFVEYVQCAGFWGVFFKYMGLHKPSWGGTVREEVFRWDRIREYMYIYVPAALSSASDWWRLSIIGILAATLGDVELAVFNTSYRLLWMSLTVVGSLGGAVAVRIGVHLGAGDVQGCKRTIGIGSATVLTLLFALTLTMYSVTRLVATIFSDDNEVLDLFEEHRLPLCAMLFTMNLSVFLEKVPVGMGKTTSVFICGLIGSWIGQVPCVYILLTYHERSLASIYYGAAMGYALMCALLVGVIFFTRWDDVVSESKSRGKL